MPRRPRFHVAGALHHVILRGVAGQDIFHQPEDRDAFEALIAEGVRRFRYRVHAFCLMTNHVHLALEAGETPLSRAIHNLAFRHAQYVNRRQQRWGHVFQGRFHAFPVTTDAYALELVRYIHLNPVRAGMVANPIDHPYSGHRAYLGLRRVPWLTTGWILALLDTNVAPARERYARFMGSPPPENVRALVCGRDDPADTRPEEPRSAVLDDVVAGRPVHLDVVLATVCEAHGIAREELASARRSATLVRAHADVAWLVQRFGAATLVQLSPLLGRSPSTLSRAVMRTGDADDRSRLERLAEAVRRAMID